MLKASKIFEKLAFAADLNDEPIPGLPLIEVVGNQRVLIEHHYGVSEYGEQKIAVKVRFGSICICGADLVLTQMTKQQLVVSGRIDSLVLCAERT